ncbi:hypothetical protein K435DRAFT_876276 [Dendrothele bispora CBS 962.96]|uniref:DUF1996 domain-containing protein n=1 Tax=Dendrothele bispora (strain CBS 962.96) TaxID=1314807 RepID=A0A4V4HBB9_DENBC|nr:hypothetical protein K435DRAFT_876276 [Dendrothele bispora CBS 962.96]
MARSFFHVLCSLAALSSVQAYFLVGVKNFITTQRLDPVVSPGKISSHAHSVLGGSNFGIETDTDKLRQSECTSMPIEEDNSNYWFPHLYFHQLFSVMVSLEIDVVLLSLSSYYLYDDQAGKTTAFPDNLRMLSGDPLLRTYDPSSYAQQAVTFLCLDFNGVTTRHNGLPTQSCPSGVRAQINFPSCWDGKNLDSPDHKSHVAFRAGGPDVGDCTDPKFPVTLPRVFMEVYWNTELDAHRGEAMNTTQPYVFAHGDRTGYGYHADFINGWKAGVLQKVVDNCHCNEFGDAQCCADQGLFTLNKDGTCRITDSVDEQTLGTLPKLPGNNPVQEEGTRATSFTDPVTPAIISPVFVYTGDSPTQTGSVSTPASTAASGGASASSATQAAVPSSSATAGASSAGTTGSASGSGSSSSSSSSGGSTNNASNDSGSGSGTDSASGGMGSASGSSSTPASGSSSQSSSDNDNNNNSNGGSGSESGSSSSTGSSSPANPAESQSASGANNSGSGSSGAASSGSSSVSGGSNSSSNSNSGSDSDSGTVASSAASPAHTCGEHSGRKHRPVPGQRQRHGANGSGSSSAAGAAETQTQSSQNQSQYKRRSLHKARQFHKHSRWSFELTNAAF